MNAITTFLSCLIGLCPQSDAVTVDYTDKEYAAVESAAGEADELQRALNAPLDHSTLSGNYLSARFAQRHHDWKRATKHIDIVLRHTPEDISLKKRAMVLAMGAGDSAQAIQKANEIIKVEDQNALALLFISMGQFKDKNYDGAAETLSNVPEGSLSEFIMPLLQSWSQAAVGKHDTQGLKNSTIHIYHAILIADFLKQHDHVRTLLERSLSAQDVTGNDLQRIADIYGHIGEREKALEIYSKILLLDPDNDQILQKISRLENKDEDVTLFSMVSSPEEGMAETMFDMGRILYRDYSDESARIFANIALFLNPDKSDARLLLAYIAARNERFDDAIEAYKSIGPKDDNYFEARRRAADLLEENGRIDEALAALQDLVDTHDDLDALIQIGDVHRRADAFSKAIQAYNQAEKKLGGTIPAEQWHIHYVRGMSYEQLGKWQKAEDDLQAALSFQPDHPFVLNYLGYSWADQGVNLQQALDMIRKAAALRPEDGYITDSLGWVLYRMGQYEQSIPHLERAVELLPYDPVINDHLGDAYWQVGRRLEARFQWSRARNHSDDSELLETIAQKMENGLTALKLTKEARALSTNSAPQSSEIIDALGTRTSEE